MNPTTDLMLLGQQTTRIAQEIREGIIPAAVAPVVAQLLLSDIRGQFYSGKTANVNPFAPLRWTRPQGGSNPLMNTGLLANSYTEEVQKNTIIIGSNHPGARLHQLGGIIRPKTAKMLAIPRTAEATRYASPRRFPRTLFRVRNTLCERTATGRVVAHYLLVKQTTIPARPVEFSAEALADAEGLILEHYMRELTL